MSQEVEVKKSWSVIMGDELYCSLPKDLRDAFDREKVIYNDYELYKDDLVFMQLYKARKAANEALEKYKFEQRDKKR